ncbi:MULTISPECIES: type I phosphomannose isomerase catalytic subunit [unclassified Halanaerobium]|uniref:type I phosphomannose isomerase catalytic subunit n=1 Tax=unclassified Halanaerobium TaxID=2641197 RepID=UPI000DF370B8|nr:MULTISPECIES: type I phosphomannose isomerase catalytic subunit [unclassified Halanaerobium]RCW41239.1 mannose-6-phosphate isomerase type 1 [Halanaerobium sp. MA284_MarDTE_T2]RCW81111.1 mannose-6-phosphate isomerase type 1 [Halanaerobium sp. DL-01]
MFYPLKFDHKYVAKIWGGRKLKNYRDDLPDGDIGESWDISAYDDKISVVKNGKLAGKNLKELCELFPVQILGEKLKNSDFPLLIKIIDAQSKLSIQVHPDEDSAEDNENVSAKNEAWYIIDAEPESYVIAGTKDCSKNEFKKAVENNEIDNYINKIRVKKGDVFFVKAGLLHAIGPGVFLAEVQQSSDTTYRVYDYGRDRELHLDKALEAIDFGVQAERRKGLKVENDSYNITYYCLNKKFALDMIEINSSYRSSGEKNRFYIYTAVKGSGTINWNDKSLEIKEADSILIPAYAGEYSITGELILLRSYVPDIKKTETDILSIIE